MIFEKNISKDSEGSTLHTNRKIYFGCRSNKGDFLLFVFKMGPFMFAFTRLRRQQIIQTIHNLNIVNMYMYIKCNELSWPRKLMTVTSIVKAVSLFSIISPV